MSPPVARAPADSRCALAANSTEPLISPFILLPLNHRITWTNQLVNEISSITAQGHVAVDMGLPAHRLTYIMAIVVEQTLVGTSRKIRVLLIRKDMLEKLADMPDPEFEHPSYSVRWRTLLQMAAAKFPEHREKLLPRVEEWTTKGAHAKLHQQEMDFDAVPLTEVDLVLY